MQTLFIDGMFQWSVWQERLNLPFNSLFIKHPEGNIVVDPLPASEADLRHMRDLGGCATIVITNADHERDTANFVTQFGAKVVAPELDVEQIKVPVERRLVHGDTLASGIEVIALAGMKTPGEIALYMPAKRTAIVGDALWGEPAGNVRLLGPDKVPNRAAALHSLRRLWSLNLEALFVGDGTSLLRDADRIIGAYLEGCDDLYVNRINLDELDWDSRDIDDGKYACRHAEVGELIGAHQLGYRMVELLPGTRFCPLHMHAVNEELFVVFEGTPSVRTGRGTIRCRPGDFIAFPVGERGAHHLLNESDAPCKVLMLGMNVPTDVCYYPDSDKVLAATSSGQRWIMRATPVLDYFDGE